MKVIIISMLFTVLCAAKCLAQTTDTVEYKLKDGKVHLMKAKNVTMINDQPRLDSTLNGLLNGTLPSLKVIFLKKGEGLKILSPMDLKTLSRDSVDNIVIASNGASTADKRLYLINSK